MVVVVIEFVLVRYLDVKHNMVVVVKYFSNIYMEAEIICQIVVAYDNSCSPSTEKRKIITRSVLIHACFGSSILTYFSFTLWPQVIKVFGSIPDWTSKSSNRTENSCLAGSSVLQPPAQ
jgi:hypothetical protein